MKRTTLVAVLPVAAMLSLTACGSSGSSGNTGGSTPSSTAGSTTASTPATSDTGSSSAPAGGGSLPSTPGSVTIGSADFPENALLADIYGDAMAAKGVSVTKKLNIGERGVYIAALKDGSIGAIPEYTGSILAYFDSKATAKTPDDVYNALKTAADGQGLAVAKYAAAQDSDTITVTKATADKYKLTSIADLASVASKLTFGAPAQFRTRPDGIPALKSVYGVTFGRFTTLSASGTATVTALKNGTVDAGDIFSTDPSIKANNFVSLQDPKSMFAAQNIVPLFSKKVLTQPMEDAVDAVSAKLDTSTLADLVSQVAGGKDPEAVAKAWLSSVGLG
ncbi:MAG: ABC transporter substrate-binding protein [Jatrophihabitans sp.]|uniref:ABC transporter substrate-binding protein n=1 Tax=Jatrophihabitans sp. TaxID=1932789 RepID=UPI003F7FFE8B